MWMLIGLDIYSFYGVQHSVAGGGNKRRHGQTILSAIGVFVAILCVITGFWHQQTLGWNDSKLLFYIALFFGVFHLFFYLVRGFNMNSITTH